MVQSCVFTGSKDQVHHVDVPNYSETVDKDTTPKRVGIIINTCKCGMHACELGSTHTFPL